MQILPNTKIYKTNFEPITEAKGATIFFAIQTDS